MTLFPTARECSCGSGLTREAAHDARGIFLAFVCDQCRAERLDGFRPEVLTDPDYECNEDVEADGPAWDDYDEHDYNADYPDDE
jgi:hypothetical protein